MFLQERVEEINKRLEILYGVSHVAVWGAGMHTAKLFEKTDLLSYEINLIVDMDGRKRGSHFFGWTVQNPWEVDWQGIEAVVISVPNREPDIVDLLVKDFGYAGIMVTLYNREDSTPFYRMYDERIPAIRYLGDYKSWEDAAARCEGYDDQAIISKVIESIEKVRCGEAAWERDSCLFYEDKYTYRICAAILRCAIQNKGRRVSVLDIGGSLGSTWFQNRKYLSDLSGLEYVVAEQDHFAAYGHDNLEDGTLKFIRSTEAWENMQKFDIVLMSASLQYIQQWEEILTRIRKANPRYVILDRLLVSDRRRICVEMVPEEIYLSSYPLVIFDRYEVPDFFGDDYRIIENDTSSVDEEIWFTDGKAESRFFVFERRTRDGIEDNHEAEADVVR